jgi:hypothetical protein
MSLATNRTPLEQLEHDIQRDRRNSTFTVILVVAVIVLILIAWSRS